MKIPKNKQEKFAAHYAEFSNCTRAYLYANPKVTYNTARTEGSKWLADPNIKDLIQQKQDEFNERFMHSKEKTIQELISAAEEAKADGQFSAYSKLREMVIKMLGYYESDKLEITNNITVKFDDEE